MADEALPVQRQAPRHRSLKQGKIVLTDWSIVDCVIRDLSSGGARLEFSAATTLPEEFRLLITSSNTLIPAARVWQRGLMAGIKFTGPEKPAPPRKL